MASYNTYIGIFAIEKKIFFAELQRIEFFLEYLRAIAKMESDFAWEVKEKSNWQMDE